MHTHTIPHHTTTYHAISCHATSCISYHSLGVAGKAGSVKELVRNLSKDPGQKRQIQKCRSWSGGYWCRLVSAVSVTLLTEAEMPHPPSTLPRRNIKGLEGLQAYIQLLCQRRSRHHVLLHLHKLHDHVGLRRRGCGCISLTLGGLQGQVQGVLRSWLGEPFASRRGGNARVSRTPASTVLQRYQTTVSQCIQYSWPSLECDACRTHSARSELLSCSANRTCH